MAERCLGSGAAVAELDVFEDNEPGHVSYFCPECEFVGFATDGRLDEHAPMLSDDEEAD